MRFVVYGAGAIGGVVGARLFQHGHPVVLIARGDHYRALRDGGLASRIRPASRPCRSRWSTTRAGCSGTGDDVALVAVKSQHTPAVVGELATVAPPGLPIVCLQNGVANETEALRRFANVYAVPVASPTAHLQPGVVQAYSSPITGILDIGVLPARHRRGGRRGGSGVRRLDLRRPRRPGHRSVEVAQADHQPRERRRGGVRERGSGRDHQPAGHRRRRGMSGRRGHRGRHPRRGSWPAGRSTPAPAGGRPDVSRWLIVAEPGPRGFPASSPTTSMARSSSSDASTACQPRSTRCCSGWPTCSAATGAQPGSIPP